MRILSTSGLFEAKDFSLRFGLEIINLFVMFRVRVKVLGNSLYS